MRHAANTTAKTPEAIFFNSARHSAKPQNPTQKPISAIAEKAVSRQPRKKPCTPTHAQGFFDFDKPILPTKFKIHKTPERDFLKAVPLLIDHLENAAVVFHNQNFVSEVFEAYSSTHAHLFLEWVKTFALMRKTQRTELTQNIVQSNDEDFSSALRLFQNQKTKPKEKKDLGKKQKQQVWNAIVTHFANSLFTSRDIKQISTMIDAHYICSVLRELREAKKIKLCENISSRRHYLLIK